VGVGRWGFGVFHVDEANRVEMQRWLRYCAGLGRAVIWFSGKEFECTEFCLLVAECYIQIIKSINI